MDRSFSYELIRQFMKEMDRVVEHIRLEHDAARIQQDHTLALHLAEMLINLGMSIREKTQDNYAGAAYRPQALFRDK